MAEDDPFAGAVPPPRAAKERRAPADLPPAVSRPPEWARPDPFWLNSIGVSPSEFSDLVRRYGAGEGARSMGDFRRFILDYVRARDGSGDGGGG